MLRHVLLVLGAALLAGASLEADPPAPQVPAQFRVLLLSGFTPYVAYVDAPNSKARLDQIKNLTQENGVWKLEIEQQFLYRYDRQLNYNITATENKTWECSVKALESGLPSLPVLSNATYLGQRACESVPFLRTEPEQCYYWSGIDANFGAFNFSDTVQGRQPSWFLSMSRGLSLFFLEVITGPMTSLNFVAPGNCQGVIS